MAIKVDVFRESGLDKIWKCVLSDDLSLSWAVKNMGRKVAYVPACLVSSFDETDWKRLFEFGRRQFLITRVSAFKTWCFGLLVNIYSAVGFWGCGILAGVLYLRGNELWKFSGLIFLVFWSGQILRSVLREVMAYKLLSDARGQMQVSMVTDVLLGEVWTLLMIVIILISGFGRGITWRGISYKLVGPTETVVVGNKSGK